MRPATTLRHLTPIGQADGSPAAAPATAADPPLQQSPGSEQPRPRTPPAGPGDGAWARLAAHKENAMGTEAVSMSTTSPTRARRDAGGSTAPTSCHGWWR
jgi:hypothetical protein